MKAQASRPERAVLKIAIGLIITVLCLWFGIRRPPPPGPATPPIHVFCQTTKGALEIVVMRDWSPLGAQRFLEMVDDGYFNQLPLYRCISNFVCQFGPTPLKTGAKKYPPINDDPGHSELRDFRPGYLSFAGYAPNTRSTDLFIALQAVPSLGTQAWETPIGYVSEPSFQSTVMRFNTSYGETAPGGRGPERAKIEAAAGEQYLKSGFPELDYFQACVRKN